MAIVGSIEVIIWLISFVIGPMNPSCGVDDAGLRPVVLIGRPPACEARGLLGRPSFKERRAEAC